MLNDETVLLFIFFVNLLFCYFIWCLGGLEAAHILNFFTYGSYLDPQLQDAFKDFLVSKGIGESLTNFLLLHLYKKEHDQYVNWLKKLESSVAKDE